MRTTVTLDPDVEALIKTVMSERGISFKQALNEAVRRSASTPTTAFRTPTFDMGLPVVPLAKALALADEFEDEEAVRALARGE